MPLYLLYHRHEPVECGIVFTAFKGFESQLRRKATIASCRSGGHEIWWTVDAGGDKEALAMLPFYVAEGTTVVRVSEVDIP